MRKIYRKRYIVGGVYTYLSLFGHGEGLEGTVSRLRGVACRDVVVAFELTHSCPHLDIEVLKTPTGPGKLARRHI